MIPKCQKCNQELAQFRDFTFGPEWVTADGSSLCPIGGGHVLSSEVARIAIKRWSGKEWTQRLRKGLF